MTILQEFVGLSLDKLLGNCKLNVAQQYDVSFLPLMWMEHNKLIEMEIDA